MPKDRYGREPSNPRYGKPKSTDKRKPKLHKNREDPPPEKKTWAHKIVNDDH